MVRSKALAWGTVASLPLLLFSALPACGTLETAADSHGPLLPGGVVIECLAGQAQPAEGDGMYYCRNPGQLRCTGNAPCHFAVERIAVAHARERKWWDVERREPGQVFYLPANSRYLLFSNPPSAHLRLPPPPSGRPGTSKHPVG